MVGDRPIILSVAYVWGEQTEVSSASHYCEGRKNKQKNCSTNKTAINDGEDDDYDDEYENDCNDDNYDDDY